MYIYICVYIHVYIYICIYMYTYMCVHKLYLEPQSRKPIGLILAQGERGRKNSQNGHLQQHIHIATLLAQGAPCRGLHSHGISFHDKANVLLVLCVSALTQKSGSWLAQQKHQWFSLLVEYIVAIDVTRVRFTADALIP